MRRFYNVFNYPNLIILLGSKDLDLLYLIFKEKFILSLYKILSFKREKKLYKSLKYQSVIRNINIFEYLRLIKFNFNIFFLILLYQ